MPAIMQYLPPMDHKRPGIDMFSGTERSERRDAYLLARKYYDSRNDPVLDKKEGEPDDNTIINGFQQAVDRITAFLFPSMPGFELDPNSTNITPNEQWLMDAWDSNGGIQLLTEIAQTGCMVGHNYVRVMPRDMEQGDEFPQIRLLDPSSMITFWRADDLNRVLWHEMAWTIDKTDYILDFINNGLNWTLKQYARDGGAWEQIEQTEWAWPYGPIVHWKHLPNQGHFYGKGEGDNLLLLDRINEKVSEANRIIRYHASPKTVGTGVVPDEKLNRTGVDELWTTENPEAKFYNLEMKSDLSATRDQIHDLMRDYLAERRVVILEGTVKDFQRVTNAGVRTVFMDMLSKNTVLRWSYGTALREISRRLFMLKDGSTNVVPNILHADPLPTDQTEAVNVAVVERGMGIVSRETISTKRGYNWPVELDKMTQEAQEKIFMPPSMISNQSSPSDPLTSGN